MINLEWLRTFKSIYEKGSMTAAAEALFISQPGVSLHLSSLENHVGYKLFDRVSRRLEATERGKILYNAIVDPINRLQDAEKRFQSSTEINIPTVTIGMCFETFQISLEKHLPHLGFNIINEFGAYRELLQKLEKGLIDLVITPHKSDAKGLVFRPFSQENIILVAGRKTDTSQFEKMALEEDKTPLLSWLKSRRWYGITGDNEHLRRFWQLNFNSHPDFRPNFIVPNVLSVIRCLADADGLAVIPDFLCREEIADGRLKLLWQGDKPLRNTIHFARRQKNSADNIIDRLEEVLVAEMPKLVD